MKAGPRVRAVLAGAVLATFLGAVGCGGAAAGAPPVRVFAAASLARAFEALARAFEATRPGTRVEVHHAGTPTLLLQLREGAPADVFVSADVAHMERVVDLGLAAGEPAVAARNRLALVVPAGNPAAVAGLGDLGRPGLRVALCGPEVPAGRYARAALTRAGVEVRPVTEEASVRGVVTKLVLGEADAGLVYATDAAASAGVEEVQEARLAAAVAACPLVALAGSGADAAAFVAFVLSPEGQGILAGLGFAAP